MHNMYMGIEIGTRQVTMSLCQDHFLCREETEPLPEHYVKDGRILSTEAMAEFLKKMADTYGFKCRSGCLVIPDSAAFTRRLIMPAMPVKHLKLNLPYEFRDFIRNKGEMYIFDYAVMDMIYDDNKKPVSMDLMATAVSKKAMEEYRQMFRLARWKLKAAAPAAFAYSNLVREYEKRQKLKKPKDYCFAELGYNAAKVLFFHGKTLTAFRQIEKGHIEEGSQNLYEALGMEIRRTLEFYYFRNPQTRLTEMYFCGSGASRKGFCETVAEYASLESRYAGELIPVLGEREELIISPAAAGVTFCI